MLSRSYRRTRRSRCFARRFLHIGTAVGIEFLLVHVKRFGEHLHPLSEDGFHSLNQNPLRRLFALNKYMLSNGFRGKTEVVASLVVQALIHSRLTLVLLTICALNFFRASSRTFQTGDLGVRPLPAFFLVATFASTAVSEFFSFAIILFNRRI